jgi:hypothetical protein
MRNLNLTFYGSIDSIMLGFGPVVLGAKVEVARRLVVWSASVVF